jgi:hypothetical protein
VGRIGSILVTRGARRVKTDRVDAQGLLRVPAAAFAGDREICRMVRTPSVGEEDDKRPHREREYLVHERFVLNRPAGQSTSFLPAVSSLGGFRTPAPHRARPSRKGRRPKPSPSETFAVRWRRASAPTGRSAMTGLYVPTTCPSSTLIRNPSGLRLLSRSQRHIQTV